MRKLVCVLMLALASLAAPAKEVAPLSNDPALEARVMAVAEELRCLVCQNETIAASHADLAVDLRQQIREQLQQGRTPAQIIDYMVARYGEFVRYRPAFDATTALLWLGPFLLLAMAAFAMWRTIKRRRAEPVAAANTTELSTAQNQRLRQLLGTESDPI